MTETDVLMIPVEQLVVDGKNARMRLDANHLARLQDSDHSKWPPLIVTPLPGQSSMYAVIDGGHRLEAGKKLANGKHVTAFPCYVLDHAGYGESFAANTAHPLTLSVKERMRFAVGLRKVHPKMSLREIAKRVGVSPGTASKFFAGRNSSSGAGSDDESVVRRVLSVMTKNPTAVHADDVYDQVFASTNAAQMYKAVKHWVAVMSEALQRAEKQAEASG